MTQRSSKRPPSNAHDDGLTTLYKFMRYPRDGESPAYNRDIRARVETFLNTGVIYMSTAEQFNDPFEASPHFKPPEGTPEEQFQIYSRDLRERHAREIGWGDEQINASEAALRAEINSGQFPRRLEIVELKWRPFFRSECPMLCFAGNRESTLMWSYYADGHTGVCVHFDATKVPIGNAQRVEYDSEYPLISGPLGALSSEDMVTRVLCWKSDVWRHEKEYRLINLPRDGRPGGPGVLDVVLSRLDKHRSRIPMNLVTGVTIGAAMNDDEVESMLRICHDRRPRIPVSRAKLRRGSFALEFERIE